MIIKCCDLWNPENSNEIPEVEGTTEVNNESAHVPKANKLWVLAPYRRGHTPSTYDKRPLIHREVPNPRP